MPEQKKSINLRFDEEEMRQVRQRAAGLGVSIQQYLHDLVMSDVHDIQRRFLESAKRTVAEYAAAFPTPDEDRAARSEQRAREQHAARVDRDADSREAA